MTSTDRPTEDEVAELRSILNDLVLDELADGSAESRRRLVDARAAFERRLVALEAIVTVGHGTMGTLQPDEPATITHGHTPNAPPHDE